MTKNLKTECKIFIQIIKIQRKSTFGVCHSLAGVVEKMSEKLGDKERQTYFNDYTTSHYKMNFFKTATGLYFLLLTSVCTYSFTRVLKYVFSNLYVELVCKNPLCKLNGRINSPKFSSSLRQYFDKLKSNSRGE